MKDIKIWTDGSCFGNPGPMGAGAVIEYNGTIKKISRQLGIGTNNIAELQAISLALAQIKPDHRRKCNITIHTDSQYAIGVLSKRWKVNANVALVLAIKATFMDFASVTFTKIVGHNGNPYNEMADSLARRASVGKTIEVYA